MFDALRNQYRLRCPEGQDHAWVSISRFRTVRRLRGAEHPAVFRVEFDCDACGGRHESLLPHDRLDWAPLGTDTATPFVNLLTGSRELLGGELADHASMQIRQGSWPWTFFCNPESAMRPGFPSSLRVVAPAEGSRTERVGVTVRCFHCHRLTVNVVTRAHLDVPWYNDDHIGYLDVLLRDDEITSEEAFRHQLHVQSHRLDWLDLAG